MIYVAHRLFAAHDRALAAAAARQLARRVAAHRVFLPFCDTDEENLVADTKGRRLYELDQHRLTGLTGMLAILHGPSLDDGVCMEIGYAAALGVPVVVVTTDFITYAARPNGPTTPFPDPILSTVASAVVRVDRLADPPATDNDEDRFVRFAARNAGTVAAAVERAVARVVELAGTGQGPTTTIRTNRRAAFCEPSPYWTDPTWPLITSELRARAFVPHAPHRFSSAADAHADWAAVLQADLLVVDVSGPETPPGAAVMIGACRALGRRVLAYQPIPTWTFASGREPNWRNLMIQYAADGMFTDVTALRQLLTP
jgi:nucleoside 2-deoxyribosyltransferase